MNIQAAYDKLYKHWLKEYQSSELTPLSQESYEQYQENIQRVKELKMEKDDKIKSALTKTYKENFEYLLEDLLKMREIKLINSALALQTVDIDLIIEAEKLLYQNLVASFKGYDKTKKLSIIDKTFYERKYDQKTPYVEEKIINDKESILKETPSENRILPKQVDNKPTLQHASSQPFQDPKEEDYNYVLVRIIKKTPPIVGLDLLNYGPYEKEDVACLPYKNAKILVDEKYASFINM